MAALCRRLSVSVRYEDASSSVSIRLRATARSCTGPSSYHRLTDLLGLIPRSRLRASIDDLDVDVLSGLLLGSRPAGRAGRPLSSTA